MTTPESTTPNAKSASVNVPIGRRVSDLVRWKRGEYGILASVFGWCDVDRNVGNCEWGGGLCFPVEIFDMVCMYIEPGLCLECEEGSKVFMGRGYVLCPRCMEFQIMFKKLWVMKEHIKRLFYKRTDCLKNDENYKQASDEYQRFALKHNNKCQRKIDWIKAMIAEIQEKVNWQYAEYNEMITRSENYKLYIGDVNTRFTKNPEDIKKYISNANLYHQNTYTQTTSFYHKLTGLCNKLNNFKLSNNPSDLFRYDMYDTDRDYKLKDSWIKYLKTMKTINIFYDPSHDSFVQKYQKTLEELKIETSSLANISPDQLYGWNFHI